MTSAANTVKRRWNKKKPSSNTPMIMRRPASSAGVVVPCAETEEPDEAIHELLDLEIKIRLIYAAGNLGAAELAQCQAMQTRQKMLSDKIWWQSIFDSVNSEEI